MLRLRLTPAARDDIKDILKYTRLHWGEAQRDIYRRQIDVAFRELAVTPALGRRRDDYFSGCHTYIVQRHLLLYRVREDDLEVIRVLHDRMDVAGNLSSQRLECS